MLNAMYEGLNEPFADEYNRWILSFVDCFGFMYFTGITSAKPTKKQLRKKKQEFCRRIFIG